MRTAAVLVAALLVVSSAEATESGRYKVHGPCRVRTIEGPAYDKTVDAVLDAAVSETTDGVRIELSGDGYAKCVLRGQRTGAFVTLTPGQVCPQRVDDGMAHGTLKGVLQNGRATLTGNDVALTTVWELEGDVKVLFRKMHVKATLDARLAGKRVAQ